MRRVIRVYISIPVPRGVRTVGHFIAMLCVYRVFFFLFHAKLRGREGVLVYADRWMMDGGEETRGGFGIQGMCVSCGGNLSVFVVCFVLYASRLVVFFHPVCWCWRDGCHYIPRSGALINEFGNLDDLKMGWDL